MSITMEGGFKRWTAKRKATLLCAIIQRKISLTIDMPLSEIEEWIDEGRKGLVNALRATPL